MFELGPNGPYAMNEPGAQPEEPGVRRRFVSRVFFLVGLQLVYGALLIVACSLVEKVKELVKDGDLLSFICVILFIVVMLSVLLWRRARYGIHGIVCLVVLTASSAYLGVYYSVQYSNRTVLLAAFSTAIIVLAFIFFTVCSNFDFTKYRIIVFFVVLMLVGSSLILSALKFVRPEDRMIELLLAMIQTVTFSLVLLSTVQQIMGGRLISVKPDEVIYATVVVYICIIVIYRCQLTVMGFKKRE